MVVQVIEFSSGGTELERFLPKSQNAQRKSWNFENFENWCSGELSKIRHHFIHKVTQKLMLSRNVNNKKCAPKLIFFYEKKLRKIQIFFDAEN